MACKVTALKNIFPSSAEPLHTQVIVLWFVLGMLGRMLHSDHSLLMVHFKHGLLLRFLFGSVTPSVQLPVLLALLLLSCGAVQAPMLLMGRLRIRKCSLHLQHWFLLWSLLLPINFPWNPLPSLGAACSPELEVWRRASLLPEQFHRDGLAGHVLNIHKNRDFFRKACQLEESADPKDSAHIVNR